MPTRRHRPKATLIGDELEFDLVTLDDGKFRAENIINLSALEIDPFTHREWSMTTSWTPADVEGGVSALGWLERESGDSALLTPINIENFGDVESSMSAGIWVYHGIQKADHNDKWLATNAIVQFPGEAEASESEEPLDELSQHFLNAPELPLIEPEPERLEPGHVYRPSEKKMSLRELIARKRAA